MLFEVIEIMRLIWKGGERDFFGVYCTVEDAQIFTLPKSPPDILVAAAGPHSARIAGENGDGLITIGVQENVIESFRKKRRCKKPLYIQTSVCYSTTEEEAFKTIHEIWSIAALSGTLSQNIKTPKLFEAVTKTVRMEDLRVSMPVSPDKTIHIQKLREYEQAGFSYYALHQIGPQQEEFFEFYKKEIIPAFST